VRVDEGEIAGGFARAYDAWTVEDPDTPTIRAIVASTGLLRAHSVAVEVVLEDGTCWSRSFSATFNESTACVFTTPNPYILGVRIRGIAFAVDVLNPEDSVELDITPLTCATSDLRGGRMFLASDDEVYAYDGVRILWRSRRVSLDGIRGLTYAEGRVRGLATAPGVDAVPFIIDAESGDAEGGFQGWGDLRPLGD
jgi:hypothetical protein